MRLHSLDGAIIDVVSGAQACPEIHMVDRDGTVVCAALDNETACHLASLLIETTGSPWPVPR